MIRRAVVAAAAAVVVASSLAGCGASPITPDRLQTSIAPTFARLYRLQQREAGNPTPSLASLRPRASCTKGSPQDEQRGAGNDWTCLVSYSAAGADTRVVATYLVTVQPDGCYAADGDGPQTLNGRPTITGRGYRQVTNPLFLLNGCFDVG
ncbi:hypothetical protein [Jatrophihabitans endophyticus]|uniref:hypothetical protein n=1 Tax=Jatrophihabitans endophyticus TaxID=1206085 RepID=UPI0019D866D3|nr:hypothetical protein [Jatrophihabitans endophyticus]MBE7188401.1 hypothetical protein [Jatrophihabitans endophyticus]